MSPAVINSSRPFVTIPFFIISTFSLTALVLTSLFWNTNNLENQILEQAKLEAISNWKKDLVFRQWATRHGGMYVIPNERTPPNPYLTHVTNRDVVTTEGMKLTLMNPAYMMRQMTEEFEQSFGIKGSITGQVLLNPTNKQCMNM